METDRRERTRLKAGDHWVRFPHLRYRQFVKQIVNYALHSVLYCVSSKYRTHCAKSPYFPRKQSPSFLINCWVCPYTIIR